MRKQTDKAPTDAELLRRATRTLVRADDNVWQTAYPHVERVSVAGLSNVSASLIDFLTAIARMTSVEATIYLRGATGPSLRDRIPKTIVENPGRVSRPRSAKGRTTRP